MEKLLILKHKYRIDMKRVTLILVLLLGCLSKPYAQEQTYNYQRAIELYNEEKYGEAVDYFQKEINSNYENAGYCYIYLAAIYEFYYGEHGDALSYINKAIEFLPRKDKFWLGISYGQRSSIYLSMNDTVNALKDINKAIRTNDEYLELYMERAKIYMAKEEYKLAESDYKKMIELDKADYRGYWGLANVYRNQKRYNQAINQYSYAIKLSPSDENSKLYLLRSSCYESLKDYDKQTDDIIISLDVEVSSFAMDIISSLTGEAKQLIRTKLKIQSNKEKNNSIWLVALGDTYQEENPKKAIEYYNQAIKIDNLSSIYRRISNSYYDLGNFDKALESINEAIKLDKKYYPYYLTKANILNEMGRTGEAITECDKYIQEYPEYFFGYHRRGWFKEEIKDYDGAIEDYTIAITLEPEDYPYSYLRRGKMYWDKGQKSLARKDFEKIIQLEKEPGDNACSMYAYFYLGQKEKAKKYMNEVMANSGEDSSFYDAACLYSLMGEKQKSLSYLEKSLKNGFRRFSHIERDSDLDNIRNEQKFKELIKKYKKIADQDNTDEDKYFGEYVEKTSFVPFTRKGKVCEVKAKINDLPLTLIFDTGASDVSISNVEASFMYKNGYIEERDFIGTQYYLNANGEVSEGAIINLKKVELGDVTLDNIRASVVKNQKAPLLLGQSVLERFGKIEIDNEKNLLKIIIKERK